METPGTVRRLDDMGRLVIPKSMRKILRWHGGDPILLTLRGRDSLLLHSYPRMQALRPLAADYADAFYTTYQAPVAICDRELVLVHRGFGLAGQPPISDRVRALLESDLPPEEVVSFPLQEGCDPPVIVFLPIRGHSIAGGILLGAGSIYPKETLTEAGRLLARMIETQLLS